jgi:hypothetical protein
MPSVRVTVYGETPPLTATLKFVGVPAPQTVVLPLKTDVVGEGFKGCALGAVTVKHVPQVEMLVATPVAFKVIAFVEPFT